MFIRVYDRGLPPAEEEVPHSEAEDQGETQPHVVRHEDQHEGVGGGGLHEV